MGGSLENGMTKVEAQQGLSAISRPLFEVS